MSPTVIVILVVVGLFLIWFIANYNRFMSLRNHVRESWADIDVELKRRYELIPNLVQTVKGYAAHEQKVFEQVTFLRNQAAGNRGSAAAQAVDESALAIGLKQLFAVSEAYPELKADAHFMALQKELSLTEDRIAAARRFFNGNVRELRNLRETYPTSLIAAMFKIEQPTFFELDDAAERVVPRVNL